MADDGEARDPGARATRIATLVAAGGRDHAPELDELVALLYEDLKGVARRLMADQRPGHTLQATDVVHEAYIRVAQASPNGDLGGASRAQFFSLAAKAMRTLLVDYARKRNAVKRGGPGRGGDAGEGPGGGGGNLRAKRVPDAAALSFERDIGEILDVDEALNALAVEDARAAHVVELVWFAGFSMEEAAEILGVSRRTVHREWTAARAWLRLRLSEHEREG
jgi:RNA polymerase sigma factor (sigma-70 family)